MDGARLRGFSFLARRVAQSTLAAGERRPLSIRFATYLPIGLLLGGTLGVTAALRSEPAGSAARLDSTSSRV